MKRRDLFKAAAAGGVASALSAPALAQGRTRLRIINAWAPLQDGRGEVTRQFAARINALSGGLVQIDEYTAEGVSSADIMAAMRNGQADGILGAEEMCASLHPAFALFTSTPGGMTERELEAWIRSNTGQETWDTFAAGFGLKSLYLGDGGSEYLWSRAPIATAADFEGKRMAAQGLAADVYGRLGAEIVALSPGVITGQMDMSETGALSDQYRAGMPGMRHFYSGTLTRPSSAISLTLDKARWDALPSGTQGVLNAGAVALTHLVNARAMQRNALAFKAVQLKSDVTVGQLEMDAWAPMMDAAREVFEGIEARDAEGKAVVRAYRRFASAVQNWTMVADGSFTLARARSI